MTVLRLVCLEVPPPERDGTAMEFGFLESGELLAGEQIEAGLLFETEVDVDRDRDVKGHAVQGKRGQRFLYLGYREVGQTQGWCRRWKIKLDGIPLSGTAEAHIRAAAPIWPDFVGGGWKAVSDPS